MADPYEIKVQTTADTSGLDQTAQGGQKIEQQMAAAGEAATKAGGQITAAQTEAAAATAQTTAAQATLNATAARTSDAGIRELILAVGILMDQTAAAGVTFDRMEQHLARIGGQGRAAIEPVTREVRQAKEELSEADHAAEHFFASLQAGIAIDFGHRIVEALAEVPARFKEAMEEGVRFNAQMETLSVGLAGAFRAADPEKYVNFQAAQTAGTEALDAIRAKANALGLDFHALAEGLSINLRGLEEGGITDIKQQIDIVTTLNQAAQSKGLQGNQASRDIIDLLNGRANRTLFGAELGIKDEDVKAAREAGKLYEFLNEKLSAYREGGQAAANTFAAAEQRLKNETEQLYGVVAQPLFAVLTDSLKEINELLQDGHVGEELKGLGYDVAEVAKDGATLLRWGIEMAPILFRVAEGVGAVSLGLALLRLPDIIASLGNKTLAWLRSAEAIDTETAALKRNAVAAEEDAVAKARVPGGRGAAGAGAVAAEAGEGVAAGGFLSTAGAGAAIGTGLVALEAGYALIKLWQAAKEEQIDAMHNQSEADSAAILATQKQVDLADTAAKKDQARADLKQRIADLDARIAAAETSDFTPDGAGGGVYSDANPDATNLLRGNRQLYQQQLDTFDTHAGKDDEGQQRKAAQAKKDAEALAAYEKSAEYELAQARESGDADRLAKAEHRLAVEKEVDRLRTAAHLGETDAEAQGEHNVAAKELTKETEQLNTLSESVARKAERQKSAAELTAEATAKTADILRQLPPDRAGALGGSPDAGAVAGAVLALPHGTDSEVEAKRTLLRLTAELFALDQQRDAAGKREDSQRDKDARDAEQTAENLKQTQDAIADEKERTAILDARGRGQNDLADKLERERDIRQEILRLQSAGVDYTTAERLATDRINAAAAAANANESGRHDRAPLRTAREREHGGPSPIHGYSDPNQDKDGGLHTGTLHTGGLSTGNFGGSGRSSAADALAAAPTHVPTFAPRPHPPLFPPGRDPVGSLFVGSVLAPLFGAPSATATFGAGMAGVGPLQPAVSTSAQGGGHAADASAEAAAQAAGRTSTQSTQMARSLSEVATNLQNLGRNMAQMQHAIGDINRELENIKSRANDRS